MIVFFVFLSILMGLVIVGTGTLNYFKFIKKKSTKACLFTYERLLFHIRYFCFTINSSNFYFEFYLLW
jgi:hypothetical protein